MTKKSLLSKTNFIFTTALTSSLLGYYKKSYSACNNIGGTNYLCEDGANINTSTIDLSGKTTANVTTANGFGVNATSGNGITISGSGDISFTDNYSSNITAKESGIYLTSFGSITTNISSNITSEKYGVTIQDFASGDNDITISGDITAQKRGVKITQLKSSGNINLNLTGDSNINSGEFGISSFANTDNGSITNNIDGNVTSDGTAVVLFTFSSLDTDLNIGSNSEIYGGNHGAVIADFSDSGQTNFNIDGSIKGKNAGAVLASTQSDTIINIGSNAVIEGINEYALSITAEQSLELNISGRLISTADSSLHFHNLSDVSNVNIKNGAVLEGQRAITLNDNYDLKTNLNLDGTSAAISITGTSGTAFELDVADDTISISGDVTINGLIDAGGGSDSLNFTNANLTTTDAFNNFENINISGTNNINGHLKLNQTSATNLNLDGTSSAITIASSGANAIILGSENDSVEFSGDVNITGNVDGGAGDDSLIFNDTNLTLNNGEFINFEAVEVYGYNQLTGIFDFSGLDVTQADGSTFLINGSIFADSFTVGEGSTLSGNSTIASKLIVDNGGIISPGNSIGTITTNNTATFNSGSEFHAEIAASGSDLVNVSGATVINPNSILHLSSLDNTSGSGVILRATSISGSFESVTSSGSNIFTTFTSPNNTSITLVSLNPSNLTPQIQSSANSSILSNDALNDQIAENAFSGNNFWVRNINRNASSNLKSESNGFALGAQKELNDSYKLGLSLSQIRNDIRAKDASNLTVGDSSFASIYAIYNKNIANSQFFTSLSLGLGRHDNKSSRLVYNSGNASYATSNTENFDYNANLQIGAKFNLKNNYFLTPRLSASYIFSEAAGFNERNGGNSAISVNNYNYETAKFRQSVKFGKNSALKTNLSGNQIAISPYIELGLAQERSISNTNLNGQFINGAKFTTNLEKIDRNFTTLNLGFQAKLNNNISAFLAFEGADSMEETRKEFIGGIKIKF